MTRDMNDMQVHASVVKRGIFTAAEAERLSEAFDTTFPPHNDDSPNPADQDPREVSALTRSYDAAAALGPGAAFRSLLLDNQRVLDVVERLMPDCCCLDAAAVRFRGETPWCPRPPPLPPARFCRRGSLTGVALPASAGGAR